MQKNAFSENKKNIAKKKKILIVNNNMKIGGVQKALLSLLYEMSPNYDVTLFLFSLTGDYLEKIPSNVSVIGCTSLYKYFGMSQEESKKSKKDYLLRSFLALVTKIFGRGLATKIISLFSRKLKTEYDCAISYMHNGGKHLLYGGCNDFVISKVNAKKKITFLHCDYENCGNNCKSNNKLYDRFDIIAACSEGCRKSFARELPHLEGKTRTVINCHNFSEIIEFSKMDPVCYDNHYTNVIIVARLAAEKGIERALHALKYSLDKNASVMLHIVGDGEMMNPLVETCKELNIENNVVFYGAQTNPYRYIKNTDILFISSYHEAAPLVIDEAVSLGVPVLSAKTTSSEDMILERGCGWVCENNQTSISETFFEIVSNKEEILAKKKTIADKGNLDNSDALRMMKDII